ncbi:MAG: potassium channel family protein [Dehalococcoidia bacterium]
MHAARDSLRALPLSPRLRVALGLFAAVVSIGIAGYMTLSGLSFVDALYQTVTTLTTVGFRELADFGVTEKLFTVALLLSGVGIIFYSFAVIMEESLEGDIRSRFYRRRMELEIERMEGHYILCGFGRVGQEIARELRERQQPFVVIEERADSIELARGFGYHVVPGDASQERVLVQSNLTRARCLLAASDSDAGNTYITLTARALNPSLFIIARAALPQNEEKLRLAGADRVVSPYSLGGRRMVLLAFQPMAADFMDTLSRGRQGDLVLAEFEVNRDNGLQGQTCKQLIAGAPSASLLGIRHRDGSLAVGPKDQDLLEEGDIVIVLADEGELAQLQGGRR